MTYYDIDKNIDSRAGGWVGVGVGVEVGAVGLAENKANSALLELEL